jgi:hypothetical protein
LITVRKISKPVAFLLACHLLMLTGLCQSVWAAMISTESVLNAADQGQNARSYINNLLAREEIQTALISQGIDPQEARNRIDSLSDDEICKFVQEMDQLPAGGDYFAVIAFFIVVMVLLVVDIFFNNPSQNK